MAEQRVRVVIHGRVQGVFFRDTCRRTATQRGVAGWVRNRPDGAVEAVFEGSANAVDAMLTWCRKGPPMAKVDSLEYEDEDVEGLAGFAIARYP